MISDVIFYSTYFHYRRLRKARRDAEIAAYGFLQRVVENKEDDTALTQLDTALALADKSETGPRLRERMAELEVEVAELRGRVSALDA